MGGHTYEYSDMLIIEYIYTDTYAHTQKAIYRRKKKNVFDSGLLLELGIFSL